MRIRPVRPDDAETVVALWERCGLTRPWNDPRKDFERKLAVQPELFVVGEIDEEVVASAMAGYDGHRGWLNYLAVDPAHRRRGHAAAIMAHLEQELTARGCPKLSLLVREGNDEALGFYRALGYAVDPVRALGKRLVSDL